ncbi:MAG: Thioredoxin [Candidatus Heimdallarchaeota archaeon AB_125]|nr:MAG: Thioredoxin [Candidatus Heimdallarchaeota archaeon AB_125]
MSMKIIFFTSPTCSWCPYLEGVLRNIIANIEMLSLEVIDVTKNTEKATEYHVVAVPTIVLPNNQRIIGSVDEAFLRRQMDQFLIKGS